MNEKEKYHKDKEGNLIIDPITKKPVALPFMETIGASIMDNLDNLSKLEADDDMPLLDDESFEKLQRGIPLEEIQKESEDAKEVVQNEFKEQEERYKSQIELEREHYQEHFKKIADELTESERELSELTDKFNKSQDKDEKIKLYAEIHAKLNEVYGGYADVGSEIKQTDTSSVVDSLSAYDYGYDEKGERKIIKEY